MLSSRSMSSSFFFFNDTATTEIYTLSLHDALPIYRLDRAGLEGQHRLKCPGLLLCGLADDHRPLQLAAVTVDVGAEDRKSTRLNSSHGYISYAVFCLKQKKHY